MTREQFIQFRKELSKVSGIDFFNPRYREILRRYCEPQDEATDKEVEKLEDMGIEDGTEVKTENAEVNEQEAVAQETPVEDGIKTEEVALVDETEKDTAEDVAADTESKETPDEVKTEAEPEPTAEKPAVDGGADLKAEVEALKAEIAKLTQIIAETTKPEPKPFGMAVGERGAGLTEEQKRLKAMGIDPY
jgi:hypothetical protein